MLSTFTKIPAIPGIPLPGSSATLPILDIVLGQIASRNVGPLRGDLSCFVSLPLYERAWILSRFLASIILAEDTARISDPPARV